MFFKAEDSCSLRGEETLAPVIPYIEASGTYYEIGCAIGESLKEKMRLLSGKAQALLEAKAFDWRSFASRVEKRIGKHFPYALEELRGMAAGSGLTLADIILLSSGETVSAAADKCTTVGLLCPEGAFLGHNEDWESGSEDFLYVVKATPKSGAAYLSLAYVGSLAGSAVALNSHGIAFSGNTILHNEKARQNGMPKDIILRGQVEASSLKEFERLAMFSPRAIANHSLAMDRAGAMVSVEVSTRKARSVWPQGWCVHTNHPLYEGMAQLEERPYQTSLLRYECASGMLSSREGFTRDYLERILRCHDNHPDSVCRHPGGKETPDVRTLASAIVDLGAMALDVAAGYPCEAGYVRYTL